MNYFFFYQGKNTGIAVAIASISNDEKRKKKQKNKIILNAVWYNISCLPPKQILALKESFKNNTEISKVRLENLEVLATKQYGSVKVFEKLFDKNFKSILSPKYYQEIKAIVINKIFEPKSKMLLRIGSRR